jgi:hypothetical protein
LRYVVPGAVPALPYLLFAVRIPRALFVDYSVLYRGVKQTSFGGNSLSKKNFKLSAPERRRDFVLDNLDFYAVSDSVRILSRFDSLGFADFKAQ